MSLVSVIIPAYNKAEYTCRAVDSVLQQTYPRVELIVVDDGSTDDTRKRLEAYGNRIRYIHKSNGGACSARNAGIKEAQGEFIAFLDCDDLYLPNKIEVSVKYLQEHPQAGFVHTMAYLIGRDDGVLSVYARPDARRNGWISRQLIFGNFIANSTVVTRRSCLDKVGVFDETIFTPADWDLWLRLSEQFETAYIDIPLTKYRVSDNYIFNKLELSQKEEGIAIGRFFERNPGLSKFFRNKVLSNWHLRFAQCYAVKDDPRRVSEEIRQVLRLNPVNVKGWVFLAMSCCARSFLKNFLTKKILRYNTEKVC